MTALQMTPPPLRLCASLREKYYHSVQGTAVRVFISYSHDSAEHKDRVWDLCERLRHDGIDCRIDQHEFTLGPSVAAMESLQ